MKKLLTLIVLINLTQPALSHEWYPRECCNDQDCAPVLKKVITDSGEYEITTKIGKALLPKNFQRFGASEDNNEHACMIPNHIPDQWEDGTLDKYTHSLICYFVPGVF